MKKSSWMKIHLYLSLFFMPMAIMYAITGMLYPNGFKDEAGAVIHEFKVASVPKGEEVSVMIQTLKDNGLEIPSDTTLQSGRNPSIGSIAYSVMLIKNKDNSYTVKTVERSIYGILVLMHKAKGGFWFNALAIGFGISLILFYVSGLIMTSFCKSREKNALIAFVAGLVVTILAVFLSV